MTGRAASLAVLLLLGACASAPRAPEPAPKSAPVAAATGGCRPFFVDPGVFSDAPPANHSCWNLAWEVPVTVVVVPLVLGVFTAPVWVPILLLR